MALERRERGHGVGRVNGVAGRELLGRDLEDGAVGVGVGGAVALGAHAFLGHGLPPLDLEHGVAQQEGGAANGLAGDDGLARARGGAGVGGGLGGALAVADAGQRQPAGLGHVLAEDGVAALADVGGGGVDDGAAVLHADVAAAGVGQAHAHARVLHGAGDTRAARVSVVDVLHGLEGLLEGRGAVRDLAVGQHLARLDGVLVADLPRVEARLLGKDVDEGLQGKLGLAHAKAAEGARGRVVGVVAVSADVGVLVLVGAHGVRAGALQDGAAQGGVGARVEVDLAVQTDEVALLVAAQGEGALHVVALGVEVERLLAREAALHRAAVLVRRERRQVLDGDVLLAAEAAAHEHSLDDDALGLAVPAKHVRALLARVVGALVGGHNLHAVLVRHGHAALRLQEGVLGEGRGEGAGDPVGGVCQGGLGVAAGDVAALADVILELDRVAKGEEAVVDARGALGAGLLDVADGLELLPGDLDGLLGLLQDLGRLGNHQADGVANAAGDVALGDHDVPVLDEVAHLVVGHVGGREHADDALHGAGLG